MMSTFRPRGHLQVKLDANGRTRAFWAFWRDQDEQKRGRRLGPAHVRDSGRRTPRGERYAAHVAVDLHRIEPASEVRSERQISLGFLERAAPRLK